MRSTFATVMAAALMVLGLAASGAAREGDDPRADYIDNYGTFVPLRLEGGGAATVRRVFLNVGGRVQSVDPGVGVVRQNQNRLDWSRVPLIGKLAEDRYNEADFKPDRSIGDAYFADGTVWLDLSDEPRDRRYPQVAFLNQDYAYRLKSEPTPTNVHPLPNGPPGQLIGRVFRDAADGTLLVLVHPFIVTDTPF
ncbi:MAG: hypothetical protein KDC18_13510 [Alphaproteobacteria bacterium]|nr:hypothetical protein [Alphaproteobacteria bacterium]MCB9929987.1 hypothetical protein [Alphaproteobacteria bacterium]